METGDAPVVVEAVAEAVPAEAVAAVVEAGAPGSLHDALAMFKGTPGFEMAGLKFGAYDRAMQESPASSRASGMHSALGQLKYGNTALSGCCAINSTADGSAPLGELRFVCADRNNGDLGVKLLNPDKTVVAQFARQSRPTLVQSGDTVLPVSLFGTPHGQLETSKMDTGHKYVDPDGRGVMVVSKGCCQPKCCYLIGACLCFFPTCGIGSCIMLHLSSKQPGIFVLKTEPDGPNAGVLKMINEHTYRVEFNAAADPRTRLAASLATLFVFTDQNTSIGGHVEAEWEEQRAWAVVDGSRGAPVKGPVAWEQESAAAGAPENAAMKR